MKLASGAKGSIITALGQHYPLTVCELQAAIAKHSQENFSRQAIHIALTSLKAEKIVEKAGEGYQITGSFIRNLGEYAEELKRKYFKSVSDALGLKDGKKREYQVNSLVHLDSVWNRLIREIVEVYPEGTHRYIQQVPHAWFAVAQFEEELRVTAALQKKCRQFVTVVTGSTPFDRWLQRFYEEATSTYVLAAKTGAASRARQIAVLGEFIIEAEYPAEIARRLKSLFENCTQLSQLDLQSFILCVNAPHEITLKLSRNRGRARKLEAALMEGVKEK